MDQNVAPIWAEVGEEQRNKRLMSSGVHHMQSVREDYRAALTRATDAYSVSEVRGGCSQTEEFGKCEVLSGRSRIKSWYISGKCMFVIVLRYASLR